MKAITRSPLLSRLRALHSPVDSIPEGFRTTQQWAKEWNIGRVQTQRLLTVGVASRQMIRRFFRVRISDGRAQRMPHYAEKK